MATLPSVSGYGPLSRLPPASPSLIPPASPRRDIIPSVCRLIEVFFIMQVQKRVSDMFRSGKAGSLLRNVIDTATATPDPYRMPTMPSVSAVGANYSGAQVKIKPLVAIDNYIRKLNFFEALEVDMALKGVVCNKTDFGIYLHITSVLKNDEVVFSNVEDLLAEAFCATSELNLPLSLYSLGDPITAVVISVHILAQEIIASLNRPFKSNSVRVKLKALKPISTDYSVSKDESETVPTSPLKFLDALESHPLYNNPCSLQTFCNAFGIIDHGSLLHGPPRAFNDYVSIRNTQNFCWARESVKRGIQFTKGGENENALKCYNHAIEVDRNFVDAYTARGALWVNVGKFDDGIEDFKTALRLNPTDANAGKYLSIAHAAKAEQMKSLNPEKGSKEKKPVSAIDRQKLIQLMLEEEKAKALKRQAEDEDTRKSKKEKKN